LSTTNRRIDRENAIIPGYANEVGAGLIAAADLVLNPGGVSFP
jgi:hypothetical protein